MSIGWDNYREAINNEWLLETPYNALKCFTDAKLERYELSENCKLSLEERKEMGFEVILLSPLRWDTRKDHLTPPKSSYTPEGGYSSWYFCYSGIHYENKPPHDVPVEGFNWVSAPDYYVYDFYNFKAYNNFFDFSFNKFLDILGHDIIANVYYGLIVPEIEKGARIMDRKYFVQEYELIRRMLFISRKVYSYIGSGGAMSHSSGYLYDIYFNNASETTVKRYESSEKNFNSEIERQKNKEEKFYLMDTSFDQEVKYLNKSYTFSFDVRYNDYDGSYASIISYPFCRVDVIPIKKVRCIIVNKYGGFINFLKHTDNDLKKDYRYTDFGSFILNDGTLLNKENSIFIGFDDFIDSNDIQEDIDNKVIRRNDLYDLFFPIIKEPSKSEFEDYKAYLDNIIPNQPNPYGVYKVSIKNELYLSNYHKEYSHTEQKNVFIDSYVIACYDYLAGGELEFDDNGLYSSVDSSSNDNK